MSLELDAGFLRSSIVLSVTLAGLLTCFMAATASAGDPQLDSNGEVQTGSDEKVQAGSSEEAPVRSEDDAQADSKAAVRGGHLSDDPEDPENLLPEIRLRRTQKRSLFPSSPLSLLHEATDQAEKDLYEATHLKVGMSITHLFQWLSEAPLAKDTWGTNTNLDFLATWDLFDEGGPHQGQLVFHLQGRWNYGTTGPEELGALSLGSLTGTANTFSAYSPAFLVRNLYWEQGSEEAGWAYRIGKITPDAMFATSSHISAATAFLSTTGVGSFANAYPDSGLGVAGAWYINDRVRLLGLISDANADRTDIGDIGEGDFYKAIELAVKIAPRTPNAGYSKFTLWHTDGTSDGLPANGSLGPDGWGFFIKHEQELTADGRAIGVLKYGKSFDDSAFYEQQAGAYFLLYDPVGLRQPDEDPYGPHDDLLGVGFSWGQATETEALKESFSNVRSESSLETFYRFPIFPNVDITLSYQSIFNPALDPDNDHASAFSFRLRTTP